jgi:hypothetical protein
VGETPPPFFSGENFLWLEKEKRRHEESIEADNLGFDVNSIRT